MARGQAVRLGPFVGGLNTASDPTTVADSELVECVNFELDLDGSLTARPPIFETTYPGSSAANLLAIGRALIAGVSYVIFARSTGGVYAFDGTTYKTIHANLKSKCALQYRDNLWIIPANGTKTAQAGGRWDGTTFTADSNIPEGEAAVFHKARLFIVPGIASTTNTSRVSYTDVITGTTLTFGSFTDVSPGDGEKLIDIVVYNDNLMLFKENSTYVLAYDTNPSDAILRSISATIGACEYHCVTSYENSLYVLHGSEVYEIVNYDFNRINLKVPFEYDPATPSGYTRPQSAFLCTMGDRLLVRYYNRLYVYGLKTRTWSRWTSASVKNNNFGPLIQMPSVTVNAVSTYYGGLSLDLCRCVRIYDGLDAVTQEYDATNGPLAITCYMRTKNYDLADPHHYKKLMWWGADVHTNQKIVAKAVPIVNSFRVKWGDLKKFTWGELAGTPWKQPGLSTPEVPTTIDDNSVVMRKFVKYLKTLRFRQMYFYVQMQYDGTTVTGPCKVFSLTAIMASKQTVGRQVN